MRRGFTLHHNGPPAECMGQPHARCVSFWNAVRRFHTDPEPAGRGWSDIAYSFGVCPHGQRLEGRGWDRAQWANGSDDVGPDDGADAFWYSVLVFVGGAPTTGDTEAPTPEMVAATAALIGEGRSSGRCANRVAPHNFWKQKPCPGPEFTALAKAWDNAPLTLPEDDMQEADFARINQIAVTAAWGAVQRLGAYLATGRGNGAFSPSTQPWVAEAGAVTLPRLLGAARDLEADVADIQIDADDIDEAAIAAALLVALNADAVAQALIAAGMGDAVVDALHRRTAPAG